VAQTYEGGCHCGRVRFEVSGVLDRVELHEPAEGLHFGLDTTEGAVSAPGGEPSDLISRTKVLRYVAVPAGAPKQARPGGEIAGATAPVTFRANNVLAIAQMATDFKSGLASADALDDPNTFTAAEFALQLVEGVQSVPFARAQGKQS